MYRLVSGDKVVGVFEKVRFTKVNKESGCFVECDLEEADGLVAGGKVYAITNSPDYKEFSQVAVFELDGEIERSAELDYIRAMSNMV